MILGGTALGLIVVLLAFLLVLMVLARPLGSGLARLINDIPLPGTTGVERVLFRALGVSDREMNWKQYLCAILGLNMLGLAVLLFMLLGQHYLPLSGRVHAPIAAGQEETAVHGRAVGAILDGIVDQRVVVQQAGQDADAVG